MSENAFSKIMRGLEEAKAYMEGEREGYKVHLSPTAEAKTRERIVGAKANVSGNPKRPNLEGFRFGT